MKKRWIVLGSSALMASALGAGACGKDNGNTTSTTGVSCAPTDPSCPAVGVESDCLALTDNSGQDVFALRLSQLTITAPAALTSEVVYNIIGKGVNADLPSCNLYGDGTFNFIVQFDKTSGTLKAGGALPIADPTKGYCFVYDPAHDVAPVTVPSNLNSDGTFSTDPLPRIVVPIYDDKTGNSAVYLPLRQGQLTNATLSADQNCVGRFNSDGLKPEENCAPNPKAGIDYYVNGGNLTGYITLEDADAVDVALLKQSLCVLLSGDEATYGDGSTTGIERCKRDSNNAIVLQGDWCSTTNSAGGCKDAFRLEAKLAASAVTLRSDCPAAPGTGGGGGTGGASAGGAGGAGGN